VEDGSLRWLPTEVCQRPFDPFIYHGRSVNARLTLIGRARRSIGRTGRAGGPGGRPALQTTMDPGAIVRPMPVMASAMMAHPRLLSAMLPATFLRMLFLLMVLHIGGGALLPGPSLLSSSIQVDALALIASLFPTN
jgi:hypothetical protein